MRVVLEKLQEQEAASSQKKPKKKTRVAEMVVKPWVMFSDSINQDSLQLLSAESLTFLVVDRRVRSRTTEVLFISHC